MFIYFMNTNEILDYVAIVNLTSSSFFPVYDCGTQDYEAPNHFTFPAKGVICCVTIVTVMASFIYFFYLFVYESTRVSHVVLCPTAH